MYEAHWFAEDEAQIIHIFHLFCRCFHKKKRTTLMCVCVSAFESDFKKFYFVQMVTFSSASFLFTSCTYC